MEDYNRFSIGAKKNIKIVVICSYLFNTRNGNFIINSQLSVGLDQVVIHFSGAEDEFLHPTGILRCLTFIGDYSSELGSWRSNIITVIYSN